LSKIKINYTHCQHVNYDSSGINNILHELPPMKKYHVTLNGEERRELEKMTRKGKRNAQEIRNALVLLNCDENNPARLKKDSEIAGMLGIAERTIENIRKRFVLHGLDVSLAGKPGKRVYMSKVDSVTEAHIIALSRSEPPEGFSRWSLRMLADKAVELDYIDNISHERVRTILNKPSSSLKE
jgi:hypothetical protein